jgi:Flp pilus assembly pilin Flp
MWKPYDVLLTSLTAVESRAVGARARLRARYQRPFDRGQTAVEYLGIIAVAVVIVLVLIRSGLGNMILNKIQAQINKIT